jgi:signal transduction histidine kinase/CheY-like chemotaxis protein
MMPWSVPERRSTRAAAGGRGRPWPLALAGLLFAAGLIAAAAASVVGEGRAARLDEARLDYTTASAEPAREQNVTLPRFLPPAEAGQQARLRFTFELARPAELMLYVEATREHFTARVNGTPVFDSTRGDPGAPPLRGWRMSPTFELPSSLLRSGENEIELTLQAPAGRALRIAPLWVGEPAAVEKIALGFLIRDTIAPLVIVFVIITLGLIALLLARGNPERDLFLLYAAGALLFALVMFAGLLPVQVLPAMHFSAWWFALYMWFPCALNAFVLRFADVRWRAFERLLLVVSVLALPVAYVASFVGAGLAFNAGWLAVSNLLSILALFALARASFVESNRQARVMLAFSAVSWALSLHDIVAGFALQRIVKHFLLMPYAGLVYATWAGWMLIGRYQRTASELEALNRDLDARVRAASAQLHEQLALVQKERRLADEASAAKSTFLAAVSHDLRQPLHSLGMFVTALEQHVASAEGKEMQRRVTGAFSALEGLFNELLDLSRLDAGTVEARPQPTPLQPLFDRLGDLFHAEAGRCGLSLRFVPTRYAVRTDPVLLERIIANLVSNALRYTRKGGVLVGARRRGAEVVIEVRDSGIGIARDKLDKVFDDFYQVDNPARDRRQGLGLGLAIVRRLARLLGHPIALSSQPGRGTTVSLRLPRIESPAAVALDAAPAGAEPGGLAGKRVLVIDDEPEVREASLALLTLWGVRARGAAGPADVDRLLAGGERPDAVIADLRLGTDIDGIELVEQVRRSTGTSVPALLVSGDAAARELPRVRASGLPLLVKPVAPAKLKATLHACLRPLAPPPPPPSQHAKAGAS